MQVGLGSLGRAGTRRDVSCCEMVQRFRDYLGAERTDQTTDILHIGSEAWESLWFNNM